MSIVDCHNHRGWDGHGVIWVRHEARVHPALHLYARLLKCRLSDRVTLRLEVELDEITRQGIDAGRVIGQYWFTVFEAANDNLEIVSTSVQPCVALLAVPDGWSRSLQALQLANPTCRCH